MNYRKLFIHLLMKEGKGISAIYFFKKIILDLKGKSQEDSFLLIKIALKKLEPSFSLTLLTLGGSTYKVPSKIYQNRQAMMACNWIIKAVKNRSKKNVDKEMANLFLETLKGEGLAMEKKNEWHKQGLVNRGLVRYIR